MRKLNKFEKGTDKKIVVDSIARRDKVAESGNVLKINCLYHHFDKNDKLVKVTKFCTKCHKEFTLKYLQYIYSWCSHCMNVASLKTRREKFTMKANSSAYTKSCLVCKKPFKTKGNYICPVCTDKINNTFVPRMYRASCCI